MFKKYKIVAEPDGFDACDYSVYRRIGFLPLWNLIGYSRNLQRARDKIEEDKAARTRMTTVEYID